MKVTIKPDVLFNEKAVAKDVEKFARVCAKAIIEEAQNQLDKFAFGEMAEYYMEYDEPRVYIRTGQMGDLSYQKFYSNRGNVYEGGIWINSNFTNHERGKYFLEEDIYENVWVKGSHGYEKVGYGENLHWREIKGKRDRINRIKRKVYSDKFKSRLLQIGMDKAQSQSYSILKFS